MPTNKEKISNEREFENKWMKIHEKVAKMSVQEIKEIPGIDPDSKAILLSMKL